MPCFTIIRKYPCFPWFIHFIFIFPCGNVKCVVIFSIPIFKNVPEVPAVISRSESPNPLLAGYQRLRRTFRDIRRFKELIKFLAAFWLYNDGVGTIIIMAVIFGAEVGIGKVHLIGAILMVQFLGVSFSVIFGRLPERLGIKNLRLVSRDDKKVVKRIAVVNGSGMSFFKKLKRLKIDLFLTGDVKYHEGLDAIEEGLSVIDIGHYESEHFFHHLIERELQGEVEVVVYNDSPVFKYI